MSMALRNPRLQRTRQPLGDSEACCPRAQRRTFFTTLPSFMTKKTLPVA
jgi:hypothetical protein